MTRNIKLRILAVAGLVALPVLAGGCVTNPATGGTDVVFISEGQEVAMGREAAPQFEKEFGGQVTDPTLQSYVKGIGLRVAAVSDRKMEYDYTLVASKVPNAFALPGGKIFLTAGLMARMTNERQLAAVLGHETAHVSALHNVKGMQNQIGAEVLVGLGTKIAGGGDITQSVGKVVGTMATLKYSRNYEYEADKYGIKYMALSGYNPYGMVELLTVLLNLSQEGSSLGEMFASHPLSSKRVDEARQIIEENHPAARATDRDPGEARFQQMRKLLLIAVPNALQ
jgi:predicted Zn-dependent protease